MQQFTSLFSFRWPLPPFRWPGPAATADAADAPPRMLLLTRAWHPELDPAERMALRGLAVGWEFSWETSVAFWKDPGESP